MERSLWRQIPRFVSHHLNELPPVSLNSIDVSCLLSKIERLSMDITAMKQGMNAQVKVSTDLCVASEDLHRRLCAMEQLGSDTLTQASVQVAEENTPAQQPNWSRVRLECDESPVEHDAEKGVNAVVTTTTWSTVAKRGESRLRAAAVAERPKPRINKQAQRDKRSGVVVTGSGNGIRTVRT